MVSKECGPGFRPAAIRPWALPLLLTFVLCALALFAASARAAGSVSVATYDARETVTITVNALGDAHYQDVIEYDAAFFNTQGFNFENYPFLLSRRFEQQAAVSEIHNFKAHLDRDKATVTLTFDKPGEAYNMGDHWTLHGFTTEPTVQVKGDQVFNEETTENNEFTLWQDLDFKTTTHLKLPAAATNVRWDQGENVVLYELAYVPPALPQNVLQRNRNLFVALFAVLIAASLAAAAVLLLIRRRPAPVAATVPALPSADRPALRASKMSTLSAPAARAPADTDIVIDAEIVPKHAPDAQDHRPRFCGFCGVSLTDEVQFCPQCGRPVDRPEE